MYMIICCVLSMVYVTSASKNGLALTPPMGWLDWERFRCNIDCDDDPDNCISEKLFKTMADIIVAEGYKDVGYEYVCVDDCWPAKSRDSNGRLVPDPKRFPNGMKGLADYIHSKGLKFGIYEDFGTETCAGYPGSEFYLQTDAQTFADWGVDLLKFDACHSDDKDFGFGYPAMAFYLNQTGRPIVFSCEWPHSHAPDYSAIRDTCNMWRNYKDVQDDWDSVADIIDFFAKDTYNVSQYAGPGGWNDPDMLIIGDFALSPDQERSQMAMWAMLAAPLLMSVDLRHIRNESKVLLQNKGLLAINQDRLGVPGTRLTTVNGVEVWKRPILPKGKLTIAFLQPTYKGTPIKISVKGQQIGLTSAKGYKLIDAFDGTLVGNFKPSDEINVTVNPTGVVMVTATPNS